MKSKSDIIIIGNNHVNTLTMVRSFGEEGKLVNLFLYGEDNCYITKSRYIETVTFFPIVGEVIEAIKTFSSTYQIKPIVIACTDESISLMDFHYDELKPYCHFFNAGGKGIINEYMDKQKQLALAKRCGFKVPTSICSMPALVDLSGVNYPCFVKPKESLRGGKYISICQSQEELSSFLQGYEPSYEVLIQDYIKKDCEIVILGVTVGDDCIVPGYIHKHRELKGGTTFSSVCSINDIGMNIIESCKQLIRSIGYNGLWGIECIKRGEDYFFLEINMRNDATTYAMKVAGANLPYYFYLKTREPNYKLKNINIIPISAMVEFSDFMFVLKGKVNLLRWIKDRNSSQCRYFYSTEDIEPYRQKRKEFVRLIIKRIFHV